jgi:hypothetical protein
VDEFRSNERIGLHLDGSSICHHQSCFDNLAINQRKEKAIIFFRLENFEKESRESEGIGNMVRLGSAGMGM